MSVKRRRLGASQAQYSRRDFLARAVGAGISLSAAGGLLAGCGGGQEGGSGTITFVATDVPSVWKQAIGGFEDSHAGITVDYNNYPFDQLNSVLQSRLQSEDTSFDCFAVDQPRVPAFAARGYLADLTGRVGDVEGQVLRTAYEASGYDGKLYSLPIWTSEQVLYYNTALLEKAGIEPPSTDPENRWTWEETLSAAKEAQGAGAKWGLVFSQVNRYYQLQPLPESLGGGPGLRGPDLLEPDITNDAWVEAFEWYRGTFSEGVSPRGIPPEQNAALFAAGDVALYVGIPSDPTIEEAKEKGQLNWGVGAHPYFEGGEPVTPTDSWSWGINPFVEDQETALEWLKYVALTKKGALQAAQNVPVPPAYTEAFREYLDQLQTEPTEPDGIADLIKHELENTAVHRPRTIGYVQFEEVLNTAFDDISTGADVAPTLRRASEELGRELEPLRRALKQQG